MYRRVPTILSWVFVFLLVTPRYALAQRATWYQFGTEGSYIHLIAHFLFGLAMLFFIVEIYQAGLKNFRGFRLLIWAWGFLALWNFDAIVGHWADWTLENPVILGQGFARKILMYDAQTWFFYIGKIDHSILLVPAFYLLYRGLKALDQRSSAEEP
jgi:hypothetical protein